MMDATFTAVVRLREQNLSIKEISRRLKISEQKVRKILVTAGFIETEESRLFQQGYSIEEICGMLGKKQSCVCSRLPYSKGIYFAEYPTKNAIAIRKCKARKKAKASQE